MRCKSEVGAHYWSKVGWVEEVCLGPESLPTCAPPSRKTLSASRCSLCRFPMSESPGRHLFYMQSCALLGHSLPVPPAPPNRDSGMGSGNLFCTNQPRWFLFPGKMKAPNLGFAVLLLVTLARYLHLSMPCILLCKITPNLYDWLFITCHECPEKVSWMSSSKSSQQSYEVGTMIISTFRKSRRHREDK